jgi:deoxyguanosine kinase
MTSQLISRRKTVISLEGNIGAGKSTLLTILKEQYKGRVVFVDEPVDEWMAMKNKDGKNLLETFYGNMKRWSYTFQNIAYITRMNRLLDALNNKDIHVIIMERSLEGDRNTFTKMLHEDGDIDELEMSAYNKWSDFFLQRFSSDINFYYVFLTCEPQICFDRIHKRARGGEGGIPLTYLSRLHQCHCDWLNDVENVFIFDVNEDFLDTSSKIEKVSKFIEKYL